MNRSYPRQRGIALLVSLILLLLLTVIAITAATQSTLQERMATNSQMQNTAFQNVESGFMRWDDEYRDADGRMVIGRIKQTYAGHNFRVNVPAYPLTELKPGIQFSFAGGSASFDAGNPRQEQWITDVVVTAKACPSSGTCDVDDKSDGLARSETTQGLSFIYAPHNN